MGALFSLLESFILGEDSDWVETGLRKGYFPLHKQWTFADVQQVKKILDDHNQTSATAATSSPTSNGATYTSTTTSRLVSISLLGQSFPKQEEVQGYAKNNDANASVNVLEELLQVLVARPELETLRLPGDLIDFALVQAMVSKHRPPPPHQKLLRVKLYLDTDNLAAHWRDLTQLTSENVIIVANNNNNNDKSGMAPATCPAEDAV